MKRPAERNDEVFVSDAPSAPSSASRERERLVASIAMDAGPVVQKWHCINLSTIVIEHESYA